MQTNAVYYNKDNYEHTQKINKFHYNIVKSNLLSEAVNTLSFMSLYK